MIVPQQQPDVQIEVLAERPPSLFGAENCLEIIDLTTAFKPGDDLQRTSYTTPEAMQSSVQDFHLSEFGIFNTTCDPPMSFRDRHRFLYGIYNSYLDPDSITARDIGDVARKVGLLMEEVLLWFEDEKSRRTELLANAQNQPQKSGCQFPPSPESTRFSGEFSASSSSYNATSPGTLSQSVDMLLPCPASMDKNLLALPKSKRGRPAKTQVKTEPDISSPDAKRKKTSVKYPCPDCGNFVVVERWAEHIDRKHFPENVWECPKTNRRTGKPCSSNAHYRPSYRHDNFATHLKGEHDCPDSEISELKKTCKFEVTDFFHKVCGFCDKSLGSREESIEHIKEHFRETSQRPNPPVDLGVSLWKEKCSSEHKLQLGIHYRRSLASKPDPFDEDQDHEADEDDQGKNGGSSESNSDNPGHESADFQPENNSHDHNHDEDGRSSGGSSDSQGYEDFASFEPYNIGQWYNRGSGHDISSPSMESVHEGVPNAITDTRQLRQLTTKDNANFQCHVKGCGKLFGRSYNFQAHLETHDSSRETKFPCPIEECHKTFIKKTDLQKHHQGVHLKQRKHRCDHCSRSFKDKNTLRIHIEDGCSKYPHIETPNKVSIADHTCHIFPGLVGGGGKEADFPLYPDPSQSMFQQQITQQTYPIPTGFNSGTMYAEIAPSFRYPHEVPEVRAEALSKFSTASCPSTSSSAMGSPHSIRDCSIPAPEWSSYGLGLNPSIMGHDSNGQEYNFVYQGMEEFALDFSARKSDSTLPSQPNQQIPPLHPGSSAPSQLSRNETQIKQGSESPYINYPYLPYLSPPQRQSVQSYCEQNNFSSEEHKEKGRCPHPECGKVFKDLKAHTLTHQNERPEKCPIQTCDYHIKGFARKYDKNRHTLTHYKGTMVCGFCPGSGSAAEKSFNRADVFKRHLTSVHEVEQTPPNHRKKTSITAKINSDKKLSGYAPGATGKCSTCTMTFSNVQDFYEHLDDCVLRIVHQEEPSEATNAARLAEVENNPSVQETLRSYALPTTTYPHSMDEDEDDQQTDDDDGDDYSDYSLRARLPYNNRGYGRQRSGELTHAKGASTINKTGRKKRKEYPSSCLKLKNLHLYDFDGPRKPWKDDMMLDTNSENVKSKIRDTTCGHPEVQHLRLREMLPCVTDLGVQTVHPPPNSLNAKDEESDPRVADGMTKKNLEKFMEFKHSSTPPATSSGMIHSVREWLLNNETADENTADILHEEQRHAQDCAVGTKYRDSGALVVA